MSPPSGSGYILFFPGRPSVCLSVTNRVRSITWTPLKLNSRNFIQTSISMRWRAECKNNNSVFYTFWIISLGTLCITKSCPLYNLKPLKLYSRNFIQISISMRWRAECKNDNSVFYTFWIISIGTLCITKSCPLYNLKPLKLYSRNFIKISISMRWHAECKNGNSVFYTFWVICLGISPSKKPCPLYNLNTA